MDTRVRRALAGTGSFSTGSSIRFVEPPRQESMVALNFQRALIALRWIHLHTLRGDVA